MDTATIIAAACTRLGFSAAADAAQRGDWNAPAIAALAIPTAPVVNRADRCMVATAAAFMRIGMVDSAAAVMAGK